jgi:ferredoxin-nitrite reductase
LSTPIGHRSIVGVHPQKQAGFSWVGVHVPVGRLSAVEAVEIAAIADKYSNKEIRLTVDQNIIFPNIPNAMIPTLLTEPIFTKPESRLRINPGNIRGHVISCTGSQFCPLAMVETKLPIVRITSKLEEMVEVPKPVRIHMTGCPNRYAANL